MAFGSPQWMYSAGGDYEIDQSLRFNDDDSAYLSWTPASAGNRRTWTWSGWLKRGNLSTYQTIFAVDNGSTEIAECYWDGSDNSILWHLGGGSNYRFYTNAIYRDSSAWYHIVCSLDTTISSPSGNNTRMKLYVNGEQVTSFRSNATPSLNYEGLVNLNTQHEIGKRNGTHNPLDGYLGEVNFIDGQALTPADFGETGDYGEWKPIEYSGTYGTNGFYLPFKQDYTVEGFSTVTYRGTGTTNYIGGTGFQPDLLWIKRRDGTTSHELHDSVRGITSMLTPNSTAADSDGTDASSTEDLMSFDTDGFTVGTAYHGRTNTSGGSYVAWNWDMGDSHGLKHTITASGNAAHKTSRSKIGSSSIEFDKSTDADYLSIPQNSDFGFGTNDWTVEFWVNLLTTGTHHHIGQEDGSNYWRFKSTATAFETQVEVGGVTQLNFAGSTGLTTANTWYHIAIVKNGSTVTLYLDGTSVGSGSWTGSMSMVDTPLLIGNYKSGNSGLDGFMDEIRISNTARYTSSFTPSTTAFTSDSNTLLLIHSDTSNGSTTFTDSSGDPLNTDGSINSRVKANPTYGQSIVSYTGTGATGTVGHGLNSTPEFAIIKRRDSADNWVVQRQTGNILTLQTSNAEGATNNFIQAMSNSTITLGDGSNTPDTAIGASGGDYIAYLFHSVTGYSKIGSYAGTGSATAINVTCGFKPAFLLHKVNRASRDWYIWDDTRTNPPSKHLRPNLSNAEAGEAGKITFTNTGFTITTNDNEINDNGYDTIYMAFADKREYAYWLDQSGNNNDWTSNNLTESDISVDSPTNNFATFNPLKIDTTISPAHAFSEGNLVVTQDDGYYGASSTMGFSSGKWYAEFLILTSPNNHASVGIAPTQEPASDWWNNPQSGRDAYVYYGTTGNAPQEANSYGGAAIVAGDLVGVAVDMDNSKIWFSKNGVWQNSGNPATAANPATSSIAADTYEFIVGDTGNAFDCSWAGNFGQDSSFAGNKTAQGNQDGNSIGDFYYTPPTGYLALCTKNLPDATVTPSEHFSTITYTGTDTDNVAISTLIGTGVGFDPHFIWSKRRNTVTDHGLYDILRGANKRLESNTSDVEFSDSNSVESFDTNGYTVSSDGTTNAGGTYVAWLWKANGSGSSNTDGSITSTVSANVDAGFSIVSYTGTGANATVGHGLSSAPEMMLVKSRSHAKQWAVYHTSLGNTHSLKLNDTSASYDNVNRWNDTTPTSTVFSLGGSDEANYSGTNIAYCFHSVDGYSKVGSYTGNGNADGTFVYTGFRVSYILMRNISRVSFWYVVDTEQDSGFNSMNTTYSKLLYPNANNAQDSPSGVDFLSNGFKLRTPGTGQNYNGETMIYIAFAETPFKYSNAR